MSKKFKKQEYHRYKRVGKSNVWRKPRGHHSKMREHRKGNPAVVDAGFGRMAALRHAHPSGFFEVIVHREEDLAGIDPRTHGARIAAKLSIRKKAALTEAAKKKGIKVFNPAKLRPKPPRAEGEGKKRETPKAEAKPKGEPNGKGKEESEPKGELKE